MLDPKDLDTLIIRLLAQVELLFPWVEHFGLTRNSSREH
jgi:hypothetical protein